MWLYLFYQLSNSFADTTAIGWFDGIENLQ